MPVHQTNEIRRRVARQRRDAEGGVGGDEVARRGMAVGEIAASAAGNADLLTRRGGMVQNQHIAPARRTGAHQARRARAQYHHIALFRAHMPLV